MIPLARARALEPLLGSLADRDIYDIEERYVLLFDRSRTLSLNLFKHIHGGSRDRGSAMVDLLETCRAGGFEPTGPELPDHLPVMLEFLSTRPLAEARDILARMDMPARPPARRHGRTDPCSATAASTT